MEAQSANQVPTPETPKPAEGLEPKAPEIQPAAPEVKTAGDAGGGAPAPQVPGGVGTPQAAGPAAAPQQPATVTPPTPGVAEDVDLIEKEWVDAAEKAVQQTAEDPYQQEEAVENLQVDYLKKRYGKEIKKPEGS